MSNAANAAETILSHIRQQTQPQSKPFTPETFNHICPTAEASISLQLLAHKGEILEIHEDLYVQTIHSRFGSYTPAFEDVVAHLASMWAETIVPSGGQCANYLGASTQVPVRPVYLTSGPSKRLTFGNLIVELRNAPAWQLMAPGSPAGDAIRAIHWLGADASQESMTAIFKAVPVRDIQALAAQHPGLPDWISKAIASAATAPR